MRAHHHKINPCSVRKFSRNIHEEKFLGNIAILENLLLVYLPPEVINGVLNLMRAFRPSAPYDEIESALVGSNHLIY